MQESTKVSQTSYIAGSVGLNSDRIHLERTHYVLADLMAYAGGLTLTAYLIMYIVIYLYQKIERKVYIVKNIFYFAEKTEPKVLTTPLNSQVKHELSSRYRILRASMWEIVSYRGGRFIDQIK